MTLLLHILREMADQAENQGVGGPVEVRETYGGRLCRPCCYRAWGLEFPSAWEVASVVIPAYIGDVPMCDNLIRGCCLSDTVRAEDEQ
jgi:hypothetical protein